MASKKKLRAQQQAELAKRVRGLKPPAVPPGDRERILFNETVTAKSWEERTKIRVALVIANDQPASPAKFVELFDHSFGSDKLPYLYVSGVTTKGRPSTVFGRCFGIVPPVPPEDAGLAGYTQEEEKRRIAALRMEHRAIVKKFGFVKIDKNGRRRLTFTRTRALTATEWEELKKELQEEAAGAANVGQP